MNMLIIGNGFDIAHGRPTKYEDFLKFIEQIMRTKDYCNSKGEFEATMPKLHNDVKNYILSAFDTRRNSGTKSVQNENKMIQELYERLDKNVWYPYFRYIQVNDYARGKNWVDFESEIRTIVEFFDRQINDLYDRLPFSPTAFPGAPQKANFFWSKLDFSKFNLQNHRNESYQNTYYDFIKKIYQDLEDLIRCLEIYLDDCVEKISVAQYSPDIEKIGVSPVVSFNYTTIPTDIYPSLKGVHYVHGRADASRPAEKNNMVLGVNEYWDVREKDSRTNFNCFKKFVQRIIKETGIDYKEALQIIAANSEFRKKGSNIYIFGHSLDDTDGDILKEVIRTEGVITTIFYLDKQRQADQIANLSKVLGQDELLNRVFSTSPTIIFKHQADMVKCTP